MSKKIVRTAGPKIPKIDPQQVFELASIMCTDEEIAAVMKVNRVTIASHFEEELKNGRLVGKMSIRRAQFKRALEGSDAMLIWLGKQLLGQHDPRPEEYEKAINELRILLHPNVIPLS